MYKGPSPLFAFLCGGGGFGLPLLQREGHPMLPTATRGKRKEMDTGRGADLCPQEEVGGHGFSCQHAGQVGRFLSGHHKRSHPQQQGFKTPMLVVITDGMRLIRALTTNIYRA